MKNPKHSSSSKPSSSSSSHKRHSSSSARKSRWKSAPDGPLTPQAPKTPKLSSNLNPKKEFDRKDVPFSAASAPSAAGGPGGPGGPPSHPAAGGPGGPPPHPAAGGGAGSPFPTSAQPTYGFQNLERRTIVLADGNVRSYFALPADFPLEPFDHGVRRGSFEFETFIPDRFCEQPPPPRDFGGLPREFGPSRDFGRLTEFRTEPPLPAKEMESWPAKEMERKFPDEDDFAWHRQHISQYGNPNPNLNPDLDRSPMRRYDNDLRASKQVRLDGGDGYGELSGRGAEDLVAVEPAVMDVDPQALKRAFLKFAKTINENAAQRKNYLEDGKDRPLQCIVCGRASKEFPDVHGLIIHAYSSQNLDLRVDHLGLHGALCVLMGWNYAKAPENSKAYQSFSADDASANREDLIVWPPTVLIHNTNSGKRKDGRMEGMGNKEMDMILKDLGFGGGKSKSMYGKEGHLGITIVKYADTQVGLKEAEHLSDYFEKDNHGSRGWARVQASESGGDEEKNLDLVKVDPKSGEKRILYGYLATASDLDKLDSDTRKRVVIKSRREFDPSE